MRTTTLAWLIWITGALGWLLLGGSFALKETLGLRFTTEQPGTLEFLALVFTGCFLAGLSQAWLFLFAKLSDRALSAAQSQGHRHGFLLGLAGFLVTAALVIGVMEGGSAPPTDDALFALFPPSIRTVLTATMAALAVLLFLEARWISDYRVRIADADACSSA